MVGEDLPRWRRQETGEPGNVLDVFDGDFRVRRRIGFGRYRLAVDCFFDWRERCGHTLFLRKRPGIEFKQSGHSGFAPEPTYPPVNGAIGAAKDPVPVRIMGILV